MTYWTLVYLLLGSLACWADSALALPAGRVVYVDAAAEGYDDGTSWDDAYPDLQFALDDVELTGDCLSNSPCEIWVAAGTYFPSKRTDPDDPKSTTFMLMNNVGIYGGFGGWESQRRQRNIELNETIFHGDLNLDDDPTLEPTSNCCIERPDEGGCDDPACEELIDSILYRDDCASSWESVCASAAMYHCCVPCRPGYCDNSEHVVMAIETDRTAMLDGLAITGGETVDKGGGLYLNAADTTVANCTFVENIARNQCGAVFSFLGNPTFTSCVFTRNRTGAMCNSSGEPTVTDCTFVENIGFGLGYDSSQLMSGCRFVRNEGVGLGVGRGAPNIHDCLFIENSSLHTAGMHVGFSAYPQLVNCGFYGNKSQWGIGGLESNGSIILINSVFSGNEGYRYGALRLSVGSAWVLGCTIVQNSARDAGGLGAFGSVHVENSILWNNLTGSDVGAGIMYSEQSPEINYSVLHNSTLHAYGVGNVDLNPRFVDADGPDDIVGTEDDNLHLTMFSPVIDLGDPYPPLVPFPDGDGHVRILRGRVDMGAYEFGIGDIDGDRLCRLSDFSVWDACMTGPDEYPFLPGCEPFDFSAAVQDHIDLLDFAGFQRTVYSDPGH